VPQAAAAAATSAAAATAAVTAATATAVAAAVPLGLAFRRGGPGSDRFGLAAPGSAAGGPGLGSAAGGPAGSGGSCSRLRLRLSGLVLLELTDTSAER